MTSVPHLDLKRQHAALRGEILATCASVVDTGDFVGGSRVAGFERAFAAFCGTTHCVGVANGTDAIKLALHAVGVRPGDEVVVPAYTFIATAGAVLDAGATPVLADVDLATALLSPDDLGRRITKRTRAVIAVDLFGLPCDPGPLRAAMEGAGRTPIALVEDAAQSHGAAWRGVRAGALGDVATFSFYPTKNLGAMGDGGAVTTSRDELANLVRCVSDHGRPTDPTRRGEHLMPGVNSRLDSVQAGILDLKLARLDEWNARRRAIARRYDEVLASRTDMALQRIPEGAQAVHHLYALRHRRRESLMAALGQADVQTRTTYPHALHAYPALASLGHAPGDFPNAERWASEGLTLPMFAELTDAEVTRVVEALPAALGKIA